MEEKINILIYVITFLVIISGVNLIIGTSNNLPIIDPEVEQLLKNNSKVYVIVTLEDLGEKILNEKLISEILLNLSDNFELRTRSSRSFSGNITKEGFYLVKENNKIIRIYRPLAGGSSNESICGDNICSIEEDCENCEIDCVCTKQEKCKTTASR